MNINSNCATRTPKVDSKITPKLLLRPAISKLKFPRDFIYRIVCGDSRELVKLIPDASVDLVFTDPPYGLNTAGIANDADLSVFKALLPECYRILKEDTFFLTFFSTKYLPRVFENNPFKYFWQMILYCPEGSVTSPIGFTKFMSCLVFTKGRPKMAKRRMDIFRDTPTKMVEPDEGYIDHPTPKPKQFVRQLLEMFSHEGDVILDPFIGSGSLAVACLQTKRAFIGFDINPEYCKLAMSRVQRSLNIGYRQQSKLLEESEPKES